MARISSVGKILLLGMLANASLAMAQQAQQPPSSAPPKLERIEPGSDTPATTTPQQRGGTKINETRNGAGVSDVQVTSGKSTYTMKGAAPGSVVQTGDNTGTTLRPPQWKVMEFDFSGKKKQSGETSDAPTADAPPPPPLPAATKK